MSDISANAYEDGGTGYNVLLSWFIQCRNTLISGFSTSYYHQHVNFEAHSTTSEILKEDLLDVAMFITKERQTSSQLYGYRTLDALKMYSK